MISGMLANALVASLSFLFVVNASTKWSFLIAITMFVFNLLDALASFLPFADIWNIIVNRTLMDVGLLAGEMVASGNVGVFSHRIIQNYIVGRLASRNIDSFILVHTRYLYEYNVFNGINNHSLVDHVIWLSKNRDQISGVRMNLLLDQLLIAIGLEGQSTKKLYPYSKNHLYRFIKSYKEKITFVTEYKAKNARNF
jgi:hypothetical protein